MIFNTIIFKYDNDKWITINPIVNNKSYFDYQGCVAIGEMNTKHYYQHPVLFEKEFAQMVKKNIAQSLPNEYFDYEKTNINDYLTLSKLLKNSNIKFNKKTNTIIYSNKT